MNGYRGVTMFHRVRHVSKQPIEAYLRQGSVYFRIEGDEWLVPQVVELQADFARQSA